MNIVTRTTSQNKRYLPHELTTKVNAVKLYRQTKDLNFVLRRYHISKASLMRWDKVQCRDGKLYISQIMACFNGEILSLCMRDNMKKELCVDTVKAMVDRFPVRDAILHSDRGSQYISEAFRAELNRHGITQSLSGVAHCYDNARMESFFATLKKELIYRISAYRLSMTEVTTLIFRYVFVYYNRLRVYTANPGGWSPETWRRMNYPAKVS